jgi:hypothetical protein
VIELGSFSMCFWAAIVTADDKKLPADNTAGCHFGKKRSEIRRGPGCGEIKVKNPCRIIGGFERCTGVSDSAGAVYAPALRHDKGRCFAACRRFGWVPISARVGHARKAIAER